MIKVNLKSPIGKKVRIEHGFYVIPCTFFYNESKIDTLKRYLELQNIKYEIENSKKEKLEDEKKIKTVVITDNVNVSDKVETKEIKDESEKKETKKSSKRKTKNKKK